MVSGSYAGRLTARNGLPSHRPAAPALPTKAQPGKAGVKDKALLRQEKQLQEEAVVRSFIPLHFSTIRQDMAKSELEVLF